MDSEDSTKTKRQVLLTVACNSYDDRSLSKINDAETIYWHQR